MRPIKIITNKSGSKEFNFMQDGIRYHRSFKGLSYDEVLAKAEELRTNLRRNGYEVKTQKYYLMDIIADYKEYRSINYARPDEFNYVIDRFIKIVGNVPVDRITASEIYKYMAARKDKVKNSTINREMDIIRRIFSLALENKKIKENPCEDIKKLRIKNPEERFLSKEEEKKLLEVANPMMRCIIIVAIYTGLRMNELLNLKWEDVVIRENSSYIYARETKNNKPRKVPLIKKVIEAIKQIPHYSEYVFTSPVTNTKYTDVKSTFTRTVKRAGIPHISFHKLRHTTASRLNELEVDVYVIKEILGHQDLKTTQRYLHTTEQYKFDAMSRLDEY